MTPIGRVPPRLGPHRGALNAGIAASCRPIPHGGRTRHYRSYTWAASLRGTMAVPTMSPIMLMVVLPMSMSR